MDKISRLGDEDFRLIGANERKQRVQVKIFVSVDDLAADAEYLFRQLFVGGGSVHRGGGLHVRNDRCRMSSEIRLGTQPVNSRLSPTSKRNATTANLAFW